MRLQRDQLDRLRSLRVLKKWMAGSGWQLPTPSEPKLAELGSIASVLEVIKISSQDPSALSNCILNLEKWFLSTPSRQMALKFFQMIGFSFDSRVGYGHLISLSAGVNQGG